LGLLGSWLAVVVGLIMEWNVANIVGGKKMEFGFGVGVRILVGMCYSFFFFSEKKVFVLTGVSALF